MNRGPEYGRRALPAWLIGAGVLLLAIWALTRPGPAPAPEPAVNPTPSRTPEPIIPTRTPVAAVSATDPLPDPCPGTEDCSPPPTLLTPSPDGPPVAPTSHLPIPSPPHRLTIPAPGDPARFGVTAAVGDVAPALAAGLPFGSFLNWRTLAEPPEDVAFWQMLRLTEAGPRQSWEEIGALVDANPGNRWIVGNEPDVVWQDNVTPPAYARIYHDVYTFIKGRDPTAVLVIGGVSQPTPLRRAYLDAILAAYADAYGEAMPVDIWNVHAFVLREEVDSWGVGIPPGMGDARGRLVEIQDHADLAILRQDVRDFRAWMAARGYGDRPLVVTEYGVLLPADYGFPLEVVAGFMTGSFDYFLEATGPDGYAADGGRLVQWWFWFSLHDPVDYPTGNLFEPSTGRLTPLGQVFAAYLRAR